MVLASGALVLVELCLLAYCLLSIVTTPSDQVQHLPKAAWLVLVVVLPLVGGLAWLLAGRPAQAASLPSRSRDSRLPTSRPERARASSPDDDAAFLAQLRARADAQRAEAERARREAAARDEVEGHRDEPPAAG